MSKADRLKIYMEALIEAMRNNQSKGLMLDLLMHELLNELNDEKLKEDYYQACDELNKKAA